MERSDRKPFRHTDYFMQLNRIPSNTKIFAAFSMIQTKVSAKAFSAEIYSSGEIITHIVSVVYLKRLSRSQTTPRSRLRQNVQK